MKNPWRLLKIYGAANAWLKEWDRGRADYHEKHTDPAATAYASSGWWERILMATRTLALALGLPAPLQEILTMRSWKTTLAGAAAILGVVSKIVMTGSLDWSTDGPAIMAGIGLIFAKDNSASSTAGH